LQNVFLSQINRLLCDYPEGYNSSEKVTVAMKRICILSVSLFLCGVPILVDAQFSREAFIPERFLPENTLAICVFTSLQETAEKFQQTRFFEAMYSEPDPTSSSSIKTTPSKEIISPSTDLRTGVTPAIKKMQQEFLIFAKDLWKNAGFHLSDIWAIFHNSIAIALVDISFEESGKPDLPSPKIAFIADIHDSADVLRNLLETTIVPRIQTKVPTVEFFVESFEGVNIYGLANSQFQVYYAFLKDTFVLVLDQEIIRTIISVSKPVLNPPEGLGIDSVEGNLFNHLQYRSVVGDVHEDKHEARIYVDIQNIWLKVRPYILQVCSSKLSHENIFILNLLDRYPLQSLFWTFSYKDGGGYERLFFRMKDQSHQVSDKNLMASMGNETFTSDQIVPANVLYYGTGKVNPLEIWRQFSTLINNSPDPQQIEHFNNWVKQVENSFHFDIEEEFLAAFGQEIAIACHTGEFRRRVVREKPSLEDVSFLVLFQIKDKVLLERTLQNMITGLHIEPRKEAYQNVEIQSLAIPGKIAPFIVHIAFVKDFLVVSLSRTLLQELITVSQHGKTLALASEYRQLSSYFPSEGYSKGYLNIAKSSELLRRFLQRGNALEPSFRNDKSALVLDLVVLAEQLPGMMWVTTVVGDGFLTESFSPVGGTVVGLALTWFGLSLLE
jgi:hypothetical protein